ncbi:MAG: DUF4288 domain-containing protein [Pseudomonas sp.]
MTGQARGGDWYAARIIFKSHVGDIVDIDPLCEDRLVLFYASSETEARQAATRYAQRGQESYYNQDGALVEWRFVRVETIESIGRVPEQEGWEVASRHFRPSDLKRESAEEDRVSGQ